MHDPPQAPVVVSQIPVQVLFIPQVPVESHVCCTFVLPLRHCVAPGTHDPEQEPAVQTEAQAVPFIHAPVASHVCGILPVLSHCFWVGPHTPPQVPPLQVVLTLQGVDVTW